MRGNNKDYIFKDKKDKEFFMEVLHGLKSEGMIDLVAWCLMDNHVHLALKAEIGDLALAMKRLNIRYAMRYHLKNKSIGHVFQDRFASEGIETDGYLLNVIRYIHRNPVKRTLLDQPDHWLHSSSRYFSGQESMLVLILSHWYKTKRSLPYRIVR